MAGLVTIRALQNEAIDALVWRALGSTDGVEAVLEANPGLAAFGEALPDGLEVVFPVIAQAQAEADLVQLWD